MKKKSEKKNAAIGCLALIALIVVMMGGCCFDTEESPETPSKPLFIDLNASVSFTGSQFVITNNDTFSWTNVKLEINSQLLKSGYKLNANVISAGHTYTVGAMQFAKSDGTRFNPFSMKVQSISIYCDTPKGEGAYYGSWK